MAGRRKATGRPVYRKIRALRAFEDWAPGEEMDVMHWTPRLDALIAGGFLEEVGRGPSEAGPAGADADDSGRGTAGAETAGPAGTEPGEDSGPGGHGPAAE